MLNPIISIITVSYNSIFTIESTIQSILNQTYPNIEYIVIDGGSTDGTVDVIQKYADRIAYWISEPDDGIYDAMNKGIRQATGNMIGILNSDDRYDLHAIEKVVAAFASGNCDIVHGDVIFVDEDGVELFIQPPDLTEDHIYLGMPYHHPTVFVSRLLYEKYGVFQTTYKIAADYDLLLRFQKQNCKFVYLPEKLTYFCLGGYSVTNPWHCLHEAERIAEIHFRQRYADRNVALKERMIHRFTQRRIEMAQRYLTMRAQRKLGMERARQVAMHWLASKRGFAIFGAGLDGYHCYKWLNEMGLSVFCFLDNSPIKQKQCIAGKTVLSPLQCRDQLQDVVLLIASSDYQAEMEHQLAEMGLKPFQDYIRHSDLRKAVFQSAYGKESLRSVWSGKHEKVLLCSLN